MPKIFPHIQNIHRVNTLYSPTDRIRLHASERDSKYSDYIWNAFLETISESDIRLYPNTDTGYDTLSRITNYSRNNLNLFDGSSTGIRHIFQVFGNGKIISADPSFPMYRVYADMLDIEYCGIPYDGFRFPYEKMISSIDENTAIVIVSNPSTPYGYLLNDDFIRDILSKCEEFDCLLVIDEAYIDFSDSVSYNNLATTNENLIVLKTLSKGFGSAGLRIGYSVSSCDNANLLRNVRNLNEISSISIKWLETIDANYSYFIDYCNMIKTHRDIIINELKKKEYAFILTDSNFINVRDLTLSEDIICKYFSQDGCNLVRFSIPADENNMKKLLRDIRR